MNVMSMIVLETNKNGRSFSFFIPVGTSYEDAAQVLTEMSDEVASMKEAMLKQKAETAENTETPEVSVQ